VGTLRARLRALATCAVTVWLLGFEIGPNVHVGLHAHLAPHHHDGDAESDEDHDHGLD